MALVPGEYGWAISVSEPLREMLRIGGNLTYTYTVRRNYDVGKPNLPGRFIIDSNGEDVFLSIPDGLPITGPTATPGLLLLGVAESSARLALYDFLTRNLNPKRRYIVWIPLTTKAERLLIVSSGDIVLRKS